jgi:hypothetical protein
VSEQVILGKPIADPTPARDAVHVAVFPAACDLAIMPGEHLKITGERRGSLYVVKSSTLRGRDGIVDPFLVGQIPAGTPFWGCLLPGTVTGLRHS